MATESSNNRENMPQNHNISSIYYIHPSDASTTQLVSTKFSGVGFHNWKRSMILTLSAKNKVGFVNGAIPEPNVVLIINSGLDETIAKSVLFMRTAQEIWDDLEGRYGYASMAQIFCLEQQLLDIKQGSDSVSEFFTKIKTIWDGISDANPLPHCTCANCTCDLSKRIKQQHEDQRLLQFMMKLNDNFTTVRSNILMMHPLPNLSQAQSFHSRRETQGNISAD
ncbi:uncharacterized protein LOC141691206 [Apium graveolens]|uniref:uncharacterized protein LOC141691206 n=1 Tax=Apium graveolens TaxID=4045 RepID=UPI003D7AA4E8